MSGMPTFRTSFRDKLYALSVDGPYEPEKGFRFNKHKALIDPYAKAIAGTIAWDDAMFGYKVADPAADVSIDVRDSGPFLPKSVVVDTKYDWEGDTLLHIPWNETLIYEAHVKGLTRASSGCGRGKARNVLRPFIPKSDSLPERPRYQRYGIVADSPPRRQQVPSRPGSQELLGLQHYRLFRAGLSIFKFRNFRRTGERVQRHG